MIYSYAIDPSVFVNLDRCKTIRASCGISKGRVIIGLPNRDEWLTRVKDTIDASMRKEIKRKKKAGKKRPVAYKSRLEPVIALRSNKVLVPPQMEVDYQPASSFAYNALMFLSDELRAVVAEREPMEDDCPTDKLILWDKLDEDHELWHVDTQVDVPAEVRYMAKHVSPLLRLSSYLALIDPYFWPGESRWTDPLCAFLSNVPQLTELEIHTCNHKDCSSQYIKDTYRQHLLPVVAESATLRVCVWKQEKEMHDRFLINHRGGYKFGRGLDEKPSVKVSIDLLEETAWQNRKKEYHLFDKQEQEADPHLEFPPFEEVSRRRSVAAHR
jgi:hypothetical protein